MNDNAKLYVPRVYENSLKCSSKKCKQRKKDMEFLAN